MDTRRILRWTWLPVAAIVLYTAAVMGMRWQANRSLEESTRQRKAETDREIVQRYGNGELKLLMFYANPPAIQAGGKTLLCYGVANAKSVEVKPGVEGVSPSLSRCLEVRPTTDTTYTLVATGVSGAQESRELNVKVR